MIEDKWVEYQKQSIPAKASNKDRLSITHAYFSGVLAGILTVADNSDLKEPTLEMAIAVTELTAAMLRLYV